MPFDGATLTKACNRAGIDGDLDVASHLCRTQIDRFMKAIGSGEPLTIACTQEAPLFAEAANETREDADLRFVNIREKAGWSEQARDAAPKIAALLAESTVEMKSTPSVMLQSGGTTLIYGVDSAAIDAARKLSSRLDVTVLLKPGSECIAPSTVDVPILQGRIDKAAGHLGKFEIFVNDYAVSKPSSHGYLEFEGGTSEVSSTCDLILDMTGGNPLFPAAEKRDGYFRADPASLADVAGAIFEISDFVGEFEKPRYVRYNADICAHSRSTLQGCNRCIDVCPTSAISPAGDHVAIDPYICAGCGSCSSVCPTGAAAYDYPNNADLLNRLRTLVRAYQDAGGKDTVLLVHDSRTGQDLVDLAARFSRGLPANVLPFAVNEATQIGLDFFTAAAAYGVTDIRVLVGPQHKGETEAIASQIGLAETIMSGLGYGSGRFGLLDVTDPEALSAALYDLDPHTAATPSAFMPVGGKRTVTTLAMTHLHAKAPEPVNHLPLPKGAPFGNVKVDTDGCTVCLSCVGSCPTGALMDDPDRPQLSFNESACVQCGLCRATCPEQVITLEPRINFEESARNPILVKREEPAHCIRCGKPFGTRAAIDKIAAKLENHSMFAGGAVERIRMCEDCRVVVQFDQPGNPMAAGTVPRTRTTEDYLREREELRAKAAADIKARNGEGDNDE
jgi:ferredoxin